MTPRPPFLAWPGWALLAEAMVLGTAQSLWWVFVYHGADWLTGWRSPRFHVHLDAELQIPFVPALLLAYRSLDLMFLLSPFVLRRQVEVRGLVVALFAVTAVAGVGYLLLPAELGHPPPPVVGVWADLFAFNNRIVLRYNLVPSLHVAFATLTLAAFATMRGPLGRILLAGWCFSIALSTLLTWQHHLLDVVAGLLLGWGAYRLIYRRWLAAEDCRSEARYFRIRAASDRRSPPEGRR